MFKRFASAIHQSFLRICSFFTSKPVHVGMVIEGSDKTINYIPVKPYPMPEPVSGRIKIGTELTLNPTGGVIKPKDADGPLTATHYLLIHPDSQRAARITRDQASTLIHYWRANAEKEEVPEVILELFFGHQEESSDGNE